MSQLLSAFEALGLSSGVSYSQVKRRYRELAHLHHPDRFANAKVMQECEMKRINNAHDYLKVHFQEHHRGNGSLCNCGRFSSSAPWADGGGGARASGDDRTSEQSGYSGSTRRKTGSQNTSYATSDTKSNTASPKSPSGKASQSARDSVQARYLVLFVVLLLALPNAIAFDRITSFIAHPPVSRVANGDSVPTSSPQLGSDTLYSERASVPSASSQPKLTQAGKDSQMSYEQLIVDAAKSRRIGAITKDEQEIERLTAKLQSADLSETERAKLTDMLMFHQQHKELSLNGSDR